MRRWWTADAVLDETIGGAGVFRFQEGSRETHVRIEIAEPPTLIAWRVTRSFRPEWIGTTISFALEADGAGTVLRCAHCGFPCEDDDYAVCTTGWGVYLAELQALAGAA